MVHTHFPLVIVIDELDRCRPLFAIDILEVAKHLFATKNVVFVLALNQLELAHSIRSIYGERFDSFGYLERFIDVLFRLPQVDQKKFLKSQMSEKLEAKYDNDRGWREAIDFLFALHASPEFNLRTASHHIHCLDYILAATDYDENNGFLISASVALIARSIDFENYLRFNNNEISDEEFANSIFDRVGIRNLRSSFEGAWIEAVLIATQQERERIRMNNEMADTSLASSLYRKYEDIVGNFESTPAEKQYAGEVMRLLEYSSNPQFLQSYSLLGKSYLRAVELIEMISPKKK